MSIDEQRELIGADGYLAYYLEKLWEWIPEVYRNEDAALTSPHVLRAIVETFATEAAAQRRSIDRLWEDTIIDYADDWAVPYIASLVGTRLLSPLNWRRRVDVANTVAYRRRAGTPYLMEQLVHDVTGWHGAIREGFKLMGRRHHNLDVVPDWQAAGGPTPGLHRLSPAAGTANLRAASGGDLVDGPFDQFYHRADLRRSPPRAGAEQSSSRGLPELSRLTFHLYRQKAHALTNTTPYAIDSRRFTLDPSGRDAPLFTAGERAAVETKEVERLERGGVGWQATEQWQLPAPLSCRLLNTASYAPTVEHFLTSAQRTQFAPMLDEVFETASDLREGFLRLSGGALDWTLFRQLLQASISADSPKANLYGPSNSLELGLGSDFASAKLFSSEVLAAALGAWHLPPVLPEEAKLLVDPRRGRVLCEAGVLASTHFFAYRHHYGQFHDVGAGTYDRARQLLQDADPLPLLTGDPSLGERCEVDAAGLDGQLSALGPGETKVIEVVGSATLRLTADELNVPNLVVQAADGRRPYLRIEPRDDLRYTLRAVPAAAGEPLPTLLIDGLWLGLRHADDAALDETLADPRDAATLQLGFLRLAGDFSEVVLRHVTLDPGGECARREPAIARAIPAVRLEIDGYVQRLRIEHCVMGSLLEIANVSGENPCSAGSIEISDSVVVGTGDGSPAIDAGSGAVTLNRTTVLGDVVVNRLHASEALIDGIVRVTDSQAGCFRFSVAAQGVTDNPASSRYQRLPRRFESHLFEGGLPVDTFVSKRFGDPGFVQLTPQAPDLIRRGGENTSEIGAYNRALSEILFADLRAKIDEYKPIQVVSQFVFET